MNFFIVEGEREWVIVCHVWRLTVHRDSDILRFVHNFIETAVVNVLRERVSGITTILLHCRPQRLGILGPKFVRGWRQRNPGQ